ncbi:MAG: ku family containing domain-containing protein [Rhodanobacter sp.]
MPETKTRQAAAKDKQEGKAPSTQAGEYVREEIEHVRAGKHGARSTQQAIAIGLSKARRDDVKVAASKTASKATKKKAGQDETASHERHQPVAKRSTAATKALKKEGHQAASKKALSAHASNSAARQPASARSAAAKKAARTKGPAARSAAAKKASTTRAKSNS